MPHASALQAEARLRRSSVLVRCLRMAGHSRPPHREAWRPLSGGAAGFASSQKPWSTREASNHFHDICNMQRDESFVGKGQVKLHPGISVQDLPLRHRREQPLTRSRQGRDQEQQPAPSAHPSPKQNEKMQTNHPDLFPVVCIQYCAVGDDLHSC